jgi:hypothetical protein
MSYPMLLTVVLGTLALSGACGGSEPTGPGNDSEPTDPPVASVEVSPVLGLVTAFGAQLQFTAMAKDAAGDPIAGKTFAWASVETPVATVSASGLSQGVSEGMSIITATAEAGMVDFEHRPLLAHRPEAGRLAA